ncbi:hypothetical protein RMATCC62417_09875 [Rhizopus microsporus]|nr:hypothetical protein RMATCC62417_09875 [Rhizopus microsporus]
MGVSQSKKKSSSSTKDMKLYSKRYLTTNSTSTTSSQPQSVSTRSNHGKHINNNSNNSSSSNDSSNKIQPSVLHNSNDTSRPTTPIITNPSMSNQSSIINRFSAINSSPSIVSSPSTSEKQHIHSHQSNSFFLPKDWESKNYDYNLHFALKTIFGGNVTPTVAPRLQKGAVIVQMGSCTGPWMMVKR